MALNTNPQVQTGIEQKRQGEGQALKKTGGCLVTAEGGEFSLQGYWEMWKQYILLELQQILLHENQYFKGKMKIRKGYNAAIAGLQNG